MRVDNRRHGIRRIVKAVHKFKAQRDEKSYTQKKIRKCRPGSKLRQVSHQIPADVADPNHQDGHKDQCSGNAGTLCNFFVNCGRTGACGGKSSHTRLLHFRRGGS